MKTAAWSDRKGVGDSADSMAGGRMPGSLDSGQSCPALVEERAALRGQL